MFLIYSDYEAFPALKVGAYGEHAGQILGPIYFAGGVIALLGKNTSYEFIKIERRIE